LIKSQKNIEASEQKKQN